MQRRWRFLAVVAAIGLVAAACGGSSKKSTAQKTGDSVVTDSSTTTAVGDTSTTAVGQTTTTAAASTGGSTTGGTTAATTKKVTATTVKKGGAITNATAPAATVQGIAQVTTTASTAPSEPVQPGGTFTVLLGAEGNGFDPSFSTGSIGGTDPLKLFAVYDGLIYADGASGSVVPQTATQMTTTDAITWKLTIRPGIKFTDGTDYNAAAVKYNWDRCRDDASLACSQAATLKTWNYSVGSDPLTLTIALPSANGQFPRVISIGGGGLSAIASPKWLNGKSRADVLNSDPVGAGPFVMRISDWQRDSQLKMSRNPNYWNSPKPYIDQLIFKPVVDDQQRANSFKAGEADAIFTSNAPIVADLQKSFPVASVPSINSSVFLFNFKRAPFNDAAARKAIDMVLDRDQINKTVYGGVLETAKGYFPSNFPYSDPSIQFAPLDVSKAQGFVDDWRSRNGNKDLVFSWETSNSPISQQVAQLVQQQVSKLQHVTMNINIVSVVQNTNDIRASNFDLIGTVYTGVDPEPQVFQTVQTNGARGPLFTGYTNAAVDKAILDSRAAVDSAARNNALKTMQTELLKDVPILVIARSPYFYPYKSNIKDLAFFDEGGILSDRLWIKSHG